MAYVKGVIVGGLVIGLGYTLMVKTTPTPEELFSRLPNDVKKNLEETRNSRREANEAIFNELKQAATSDTPIWLMNPNDRKSTK